MKAYSPNPGVNETIELLLSLGLPPLPVAPKQDPRASDWYHVVVRHNPEVHKNTDQNKPKILGDFCPLTENGEPSPRFTGKNPSYLDWQGNARPVKHGEFQSRLPNEDELKRWFAHPDTGIGTLGGHAGTDWLDFDAKNYPSQEDCDRDVERVRQDVGLTWVERTGSGGYRIAVRPRETPWFTNFATSPDGNHVGEALYTGRFTVLAPTVHASGNRYVRLTTATPAEIDSLESIGIYPSNTADKRGKGRVTHRSGRYTAERRDADAWDIRNFAQYLDSVHERGGMIRFRCPVCDDQSRIDTAFINPASGAFSCFAGCDPKLIYRDAMAIAIAAGHQLPKRELQSWNESDRPAGLAKKDTPKAIPGDFYKLTFTPDIEVCDRHFSEDIEIPESAKLIVIKAAKGVGKSHLAARLTPPGKRKLLLTHRDRLGRHLATRFDVPYLEQVRIQTNAKGVGCCFDSAHPESAIAFEGADWVDADIFIDESEQSLWHLLNSGTIGDKRRLAILKEVSVLLAGALSPESKGRVFLMDADLSDLSIDTVRSLGGHPSLAPYVILNTYEIQKNKAYCYPSDEEMLSKLEGELNDGGRVMVLTAAQKASSKYSSINLEKRWGKLYPGKRILRIDAETIANPEHPAYGCSDNINQVVQRYDIVLLTSVFESGVSIDVFGYFTGVWAFARSGHLPENTIRQWLSRLRDWEVTRHCSFPTEGNNRAFIGDRHCTDVKSLLEAQTKLARKNVSALALAGIEVDMDGSISNNTAALTAWAKFGARLNQTFNHYEAALLIGLESEGYQVVKLDPAIGDEVTARIKDEVTAQRDESQVEYAEAVATRGTEPQSKEQYEELKKKRAKTDDERYAERRYELRRSYGVDVTPKLVQRDDKGWYSFLRVQYLLSLSSQELAQDEGDRLEKQVHQKQVFVPDVNKKSVYAKVDLLQKLGIGILLDPEREFTSESPEVQLAAAIAIANAAEVKLILGITATEQSTAMAICQEILKQTVGFRLKAQQRRVGGERTRFYSYAHCLEDKDLSVELAERQEVFAAWRARAEHRQLSHETSNRSLTSSSVTCDGVSVHTEWFAPGAIADAQASLDNASDDETRELVLSLTPEHIRALLTREQPQFKAPGDRSPQRKTGRTEPRPTHLKVVPPPTIPTEVPA